MPEPTESTREIAQVVAEQLGGRPRVPRFWDEAHANFIDIATFDNSPSPGLTSYATLGLSEAPLMDDGRDVGLRVEFVGMANSEFAEFRNVMASAAFSVINDQEFVYPDRIFPGLVELYFPNLAMKHLLFSPPFLFEGLRTQELSDRTVAFLLLVPISDAELNVARTQGSAALNRLLAANNADVANLRRASVA